MGVEEGNEEAADGAGQRHISSRECRRSKTAFDGLCPAVATLERDFEQTIAYYALEGVARELIRTTSLLERTNRELFRLSQSRPLAKDTLPIYRGPCVPMIPPASLFVIGNQRASCPFLCSTRHLIPRSIFLASTKSTGQKNGRVSTRNSRGP